MPRLGYPVAEVFLIVVLLIGLILAIILPLFNG